MTLTIALAPTILKEIAKNVAMGVPAICRARTSRARTAKTPEAARLDRACYDLLDQVLAHTGPPVEKSVIEIGPGDNLVMGLALLASGTRDYTALDRFPGAYADAQARRWYALLAADWPRKYPALPWPAGLEAAHFPDCAGAAVRTVPMAIEDCRIAGTFDLVCSRAVGGLVRDVAKFARATRGALRRGRGGGTAVHIVDFSGHQWDSDHDPLLFRRFSKPVWHAMGSNRGFPNRVPYAAFRAILEANGLMVEVPHTRTWPSGEVREAVFVCRRAGNG